MEGTEDGEQLVSEVTYNLPPDHSERLASEVGQLTLAHARDQLAKDLKAEHAVWIIRGPEALGKTLFKSIGVSNSILK